MTSLIDDLVLTAYAVAVPVKLGDLDIKGSAVSNDKVTITWGRIKQL